MRLALLGFSGRKSGQTRSPARDRGGVEAGVERGLTAQRIWQDLCEEHGFAYGYLSVQRFVRGIRGRRPEVVDVMEHPPGKEAQVDYFQSPALALDPITGKWGRPWIF